MPVGIRSSHSGVSIMSTSVLVAKERQPGFPSGLGQKQAKKQKIRRKCATVARYSMLYRFLCNALQRDGVQPGPDLAFGLCCSVPFHNNSWYSLQKHPPLPLMQRVTKRYNCDNRYKPDWKDTSLVLFIPVLAVQASHRTRVPRGQRGGWPG